MTDYMTNSEIEGKNSEDDSLRPEDLAWQRTYDRENDSDPSWDQHGMPALFEDFLAGVRNSHAYKKRLGEDGEEEEQIHLDAGCGPCTKTVAMATRGLNVVGVDLDDARFSKGMIYAKEMAVADRCRFVKADCAKNIPFPDKSVTSFTDILMSTHLDNEEYPDESKSRLLDKYLDELNRVLVDGAEGLFVLFHIDDEHFHGHPVTAEYRFDPAKVNKVLEPEWEKYEKDYPDMLNRHHSRDDVFRLYGEKFDVIQIIEVQHPVYPHRKLWNVRVKKKADGQSSTD